MFLINERKINQITERCQSSRPNGETTSTRVRDELSAGTARRSSRPSGETTSTWVRDELSAGTARRSSRPSGETTSTRVRDELAGGLAANAQKASAHIHAEAVWMKLSRRTVCIGNRLLPDGMIRAPVGQYRCPVVVRPRFLGNQTAYFGAVSGGGTSALQQNGRSNPTLGSPRPFFR